MSLAEELLKKHKRNIARLVLVPGDSGCFEVTRNGSLLFSKLAVGRFPEDGEVAAILTGNKKPVIA